MSKRTYILIAVVSVLAIANLNLWAINKIDRGIDRQAEARRIVMQEQRTRTIYYCYTANRREKK